MTDDEFAGEQSIADYMDASEAARAARAHLAHAGPATQIPRLSSAAKEVDAPSHYVTAGGLECIDAIAEATKGLQGIEAFCVGNSLKYLWRHDKKNGNEDLKKALWYIERALAERKKRGAK